MCVIVSVCHCQCVYVYVPVSLRVYVHVGVSVRVTTDLDVAALEKVARLAKEAVMHHVVDVELVQDGVSVLWGPCEHA
jgi:hypothetical protein